MLFLVEQVFVGRDEVRARLKTCVGGYVIISITEKEFNKCRDYNIYK